MTITTDIRNAYDSRDRDQLERALARVAALEQADKERIEALRVETGEQL